ncbi:protein ATAF2-like [Populus alba x Populus x berolinensis]|nr:protein ATAF2-like [Populus alba x Populus x berolinensis]KAJ6924449.1 protein ATAF2-like [Populus alba x Populus x berolinensis]
MFEYSLPSLSEQTVLCQLKRKEVHASEKVQTTTTATKRRKRYADGLDDATNTMFQKPRVEEDAQKQQILEPVFDNGVQSDNFESFYREPSAVLENYLMDADSGFTSTSNAAPPTVFTLDPAENLQPTTEDDDFPPEIFGLLDLSGYCDEEDGVPATQETAEASAYWVQAIPTIDPSFTADAIDYYLERGVFDSSLANCSGSFLQMQLQAATSPIQENEIQMISNPFHMKRYR